MVAMLNLAGAARGDHFKVFILSGQSNMVGQGVSQDLSAPYQQPLDHVLCSSYGEANDPAPLQPVGTEFGPEMAFGHRLAEARPDEQFLLIKFAVGGAPIGAFRSASWRYPLWVDHVRSGIEQLTDAGHTTEFAGLLWTQGEADAVLGPRQTSNDFDGYVGTTGNYVDALTHLIANMRNEFDANLPAFISRLSSEQVNAHNIEAEYLANIRAAQEWVTAIDPLANLINTDDFALHGDNKHFNTAGQLALGEAFADSYLVHTPEPGTFGVLMMALLAGVSRRRRVNKM